jgi:translation initiation factor IF-2
LWLKLAKSGGLEAIEHEIKKIKNDKIKIKVISSSVGDITENDVKVASGRADTIILGIQYKS